MGIRAAIFVGLGAALAGCAGTGAHEPVDATTLVRFDGTAISQQELDAVRTSAIATAVTIERLEKELREPWAEHRDPYTILRRVSEEHPGDTRIARTMWEGAEPAPRGQGREPFREFGYYRNQVDPAAMLVGVRPRTLEDRVADMLAEHGDGTPRQQALAVWRRFSPSIQARGDGYLASHWRLGLEGPGNVRVAVSESLLGPHVRSEILEADEIIMPGADETLAGYTAPGALINLMLPEAVSPVRPAIDALHAMSAGAPVELPCGLSPGPVESDGAADARFLRVVLRGLKNGSAELSAVPASADRVTVTFSYLIEDAEARSTLSFSRSGRDWTLTRFDYEPAAASILKGSAQLDLMPMLRAQAQVSGRE